MIENDVFLWIFLVVLILLLVAPTIRHLYSGWRYRRDTILDEFDDKAKTAYFKAFHPSSAVPNGESPSSRFKKHYHERFGRRHFILPLILLFLITSWLLLWSGFSIHSWLVSGKLDAFLAHHLSLFSVIAISGAYLYSLSDQIQRWYTWDLSPADLYWASFRLVAAIPLGWVLRYFVAPNLAIGRDYLPRLTLHGIRGAFEMRNICLDLESENAELAAGAKEKLRIIAAQISYPSPEASRGF